MWSGSDRCEVCYSTRIEGPRRTVPQTQFSLHAKKLLFWQTERTLDTMSRKTFGTWSLGDCVPTHLLQSRQIEQTPVNFFRRDWFEDKFQSAMVRTALNRLWRTVVVLPS
ncbi:hypothetical protein V1527DRAFT_57980 [Lipomyces starkeyi]